MAERLRAATPADLDAVLALLVASDLPEAGVAEHLGDFLVAEDGGRLVGVAGIEVHGRDGVLRSVVVDPDRRGTGLGGRLTESALAVARYRGLRRLYLLTTTAEDYFPRHGFRRIERAAAPPNVRQSVEFREACPASAVAMALDLGA